MLQISKFYSIGKKLKNENNYCTEGHHIPNGLLERLVYTVKPKLSAMSFELPKPSINTSIKNINWRIPVNHMTNLLSNVTPSLECRYRSCRSSYQNFFNILQSGKLFRDYL